MARKSLIIDAVQIETAEVGFITTATENRFPDFVTNPQALLFDRLEDVLIAVAELRFSSESTLAVELWARGPNNSKLAAHGAASASNASGYRSSCNVPWMTFFHSSSFIASPPLCQPAADPKGDELFQ